MTEFEGHDFSDESPRATNRSGVVRLPIKAGASGAEKANSRRNDASAHHGAVQIFLSRAARGAHGSIVAAAKRASGCHPLLAALEAW